MPTLMLRTVGMSYVIEGLVTAGLDAARLLDALEEVHGIAVAPMSTPRTLEPGDDERGLRIDAMIIDRRAVPWDALRDWLEAWVTRQGYVYVAWADDGRNPSASTLHFHR